MPTLNMPVLTKIEVRVCVCVHAPAHKLHLQLLYGVFVYNSLHMHVCVCWQVCLLSVYALMLLLCVLLQLCCNVSCWLRCECIIGLAEPSHRFQVSTSQLLISIVAT